MPIVKWIFVGLFIGLLSCSASGSGSRLYGFEQMKCLRYLGPTLGVEVAVREACDEDEGWARVGHNVSSEDIIATEEILRSIELKEIDFTVVHGIEYYRRGFDVSEALLAAPLVSVGKVQGQLVLSFKFPGGFFDVHKNGDEIFGSVVAL